jgi:DNA-directed RNA polymerase I, II, and III subunit RPABC2
MAEEDDIPFVDAEDGAEEEVLEEEEYLEAGIIEVPVGQLDGDRRYDITNTAKNKIPNDKRTTRNYISKYERAKIIGVRAQQISLGAIPNIELPKNHHMTPRDIARLELDQKKSPIIIQRIFHTGKYEEWKVEELI